jgi:hypothetical protein
MSLVIDALKRAAAGPGTDRHTRVGSRANS